MVARALEVLLKRADFSSDSCEALANEIASQERRELLRSAGRLESRKRFKGMAGHPILDKRMVGHLYIDEGGKSNPEPNIAGPTYFALGAVAISDLSAVAYRASADLLKTQFFGTTDLTFHEPSMRQHVGPYFFNGSAARQDEFDTALTRLINATEFTVFGVGIRKEGFKQDFVDTHLDPYLPTDAYAIAIVMLLERYVDYLAMSCSEPHMGRVTFESQGPLEDALHRLEYVNLLIDGSQWVPDSAFRNWLETGLRFAPKQGSDPMELADMVSRDLYEWVRAECTGKPKYWALLGEKVYRRGDGQMGKFGIKVFPDSDIRERIEAHRRDCGAGN